ncbi:2-hydroxyhexa-2,4-dienoate hydratase [compost metagenome]
MYGFLTDYGACMDGAAIDTGTLIHPKVEAEIAFVLKAPLKGPGCHIGDVLAATDFVVPAVEVIDSRYENFRFDLKSVIADNTSSARFVVGGTHRGAEGLDLKNLGVVLEKNGEVVATAAGAAVLGHPANSVAMLANMLGARGRELPAGTFIMTGGVTEAIAVAAGDNITVRYQHLGTVSMRFT